MISDFILEFRRYNDYLLAVLDQIDEATINTVPVADGNSIGMIIQHLRGNLRSRFTDFLTSDGEKPWRNRETEFAHNQFTADEARAMWTEGWDILAGALDALKDADLDLIITIRGQDLTVRAALMRSLAHVSFHVGQIVLLARTKRGKDWTYISIPRGGSAAYNLNPTSEKGFS